MCTKYVIIPKSIYHIYMVNKLLTLFHLTNQLRWPIDEILNYMLLYSCNRISLALHWGQVTEM